jgi:hypothetical protein
MMGVDLPYRVEEAGHLDRKEYSTAEVVKVVGGREKRRVGRELTMVVERRTKSRESETQVASRPRQFKHTPHLSEYGLCVYRI